MAVEKKEFSDECVVEGPYSNGSVNAAVVRFEGDIDAITHDTFEAAIAYAFQQGHAVLDAGGINCMSSTGYGVLIAQHSAGEKKGLELLLVNTPSDLIEIFRVLGLDKVLTSYATIDDALKEEDPKKREIIEVVRPAF